MSDPQPPPVPPRHGLRIRSQPSGLGNHSAHCSAACLWASWRSSMPPRSTRSAAGDLPAARKASHKAKFRALISFAIAAIPLILYPFFTLLLASLGILGGLSGVH